MSSFLPSNGRISVHFDNIHLKLSTHVHFEVRFYPMLSEYKYIFMMSSQMNFIKGKVFWFHFRLTLSPNEAK